MCHMYYGAGRGVELIAEFRGTEHEDAIPGDVDIVEDDDGVDFVEAPAQRMATPIVKVLATDEAQPSCVAVDGEREAVRGVFRPSPQDGGRKHEQLVGDRSDRRQHPSPPDDDSIVVLCDDVRGE